MAENEHKKREKTVEVQFIYKTYLFFIDHY